MKRVGGRALRRKQLSAALGLGSALAGSAFLRDVQGDLPSKAPADAGPDNATRLNEVGVNMPNPSFGEPAYESIPPRGTPSVLNLHSKSQELQSPDFERSEIENLPIGRNNWPRANALSASVETNSDRIIKSEFIGSHERPAAASATSSTSGKLPDTALAAPQNDATWGAELSEQPANTVASAISPRPKPMEIPLKPVENSSLSNQDSDLRTVQQAGSPGALVGLPSATALNKGFTQPTVGPGDTASKLPPSPDFLDVVISAAKPSPPEQVRSGGEETVNAGPEVGSHASESAATLGESNPEQQLDPYKKPGAKPPPTRGGEQKSADAETSAQMIDLPRELLARVNSAVTINNRELFNDRQIPTVPPRAATEMRPAAAAKAEDTHKLPSMASSSAASRLPRPLFGHHLTPNSALPELKPDISPAAEMPQPDLSGAGPMHLREAVSDSHSNVRRDFHPVLLSSDDELILEASAGSGTAEVSQTITAYGSRSAVYLPVGELTRLMDLPVSISDDGQFASGWALEEDNRISIDLRKGEIVTNRNTLPLASTDAAFLDGELYLRLERWSDFLPLKLDVDLRNQAVRIRTTRPFPFEERARRQEAREMLESRHGNDRPSNFRREKSSWRSVDAPLSEFEVRSGSDSQRTIFNEGDVRVAGDLGWLTARAFATISTSRGFEAARIELGRRDPDARLLGPLRAAEFQIGDVLSPSLDLGLRSASGRGMTLTNVPISQASVFDRIELRGELPAGYEVELYRNNNLIGSASRPLNGQYVFARVPLEFGLNVMRLVFYGPQGQRSEEVRRILAGDGTLAKGRLQYALGILQKDTTLAGVQANGYTPPADQGSLRAMVDFQYGLATAMTLRLGAAAFKNDAGRQWLVTPGLQASIHGLSGRFDFGLTSSGGRAFVAAVAGRVGVLNWTLLRGQYANGFIDEQRSLTQKPLRQATDIQVTGLISMGGLHVGSAIPFAGSLRRLEFADGSKETDSTLRASYLTKGLLLSSSLAYQASVQHYGASLAKLVGNFDLSTVTAGRTQARAALDYRIAPAFRIEAAQFEVSRALGRATMMRAALTRSFTGRTTQLGFAIARSIGPLAASLDAAKFIARPAFSLTLRIGMSFGLNPLSGRLFAAKPGAAESGAAVLRAFVDANGNHHFDEGERRAAGLRFTSASDSVATDEDGLALLTGLGDGVHNSVRLDLDSLPDIDLSPESPGIEFTPRAGHVDIFDFPLIRLAELSGGVVLGDNSRPVSGIQIILISASGEIVARDRTSAGGTFFFERIPPGTYRIAVEPRQAHRLGIHELGTPLSVTLTGESCHLSALKIAKDTLN